MDIDGHIECLCPLEYGREHILIEIVSVGMPIDERAFESKLDDGPLQLIGSIHGRLGRQHCKTGETCGDIPE